MYIKVTLDKLKKFDSLSFKHRIIIYFSHWLLCRLISLLLMHSTSSSTTYLGAMPVAISIDYSA